MLVRFIHVTECQLTLNTFEWICVSQVHCCLQWYHPCWLGVFACHTHILSMSCSHICTSLCGFASALKSLQMAKAHLQMYLMTRSLCGGLCRKFYRSEETEGRGSSLPSGQCLCSHSSIWHASWGLTHSAKNSTLKVPTHKESWQSTGLHSL